MKNLTVRSSTVFPAMGWQAHYPVPTVYHRERVSTTEYLDGRGVSVADSDRRGSMADLSSMMKWPGMRGPVLREVHALAKQTQITQETPIRLMEVGCGTGELGRWMAVKLAKMGFSIELILSDLRTDHILPTPEHIAQNPQISETQVSCDLLSGVLPVHDISVMHFVLHHFDDERVATILKRLAGAARLGGVVSDLERHPVAFHFTRLAFPLLMRSPVTVADGLLSVQQAFSQSEWHAHANHFFAGGAQYVETKSYFPYRLLLRWQK